MAEGPADKQAKAEVSNNEENGTPETNRKNLEKRLAAFAADIRANAADAEKQRRAATPLETRSSATNVVPPESRGPDRIEDVKVVLAPGLDPRHEPTLVGRRDERRNRWDFAGDGDIIDPEESSELQAAPIPLEQLPPEAHTARKRSVLVIFALTTGVLLAIVLFSVRQLESTQSTALVTASTTALPMKTSEQPKVPEPSGSQKSADPIDTAPAPSNAVPELPTDNEIAPAQPITPRKQARHGGGKSNAGVKGRGRGPLGGEPEY